LVISDDAQIRSEPTIPMEMIEQEIQNSKGRDHTHQQNKGTQVWDFSVSHLHLLLLLPSLFFFLLLLADTGLLS
jgi:hypothetical protein